ncbi:MAG: ParA family protein [Leptospiraceae bacterium]|nr:ParA family protein [Leptospiraceae bacterium]MCK6382192.1 ParA family protein [Leptospiraceae bacterium]NUM42770.1 ParA family protein [Leptospiraceae bacterium]
MKQILCITNQKGGVGKTTTSVHIAVGLAKKGERTLLIDLDPQGNSSSIFVSKETDSEKTIYPVFRDKIAPIQNLISETRIENLKIIPSNIKLSEVDSILSGKLDGFFMLRDSMEMIKEDFDYVVIDCPPSLSMLTLNALVAGTGIIIPLQVSKFSIDGIEGILDIYETVTKRYNPNLKIFGALLSMFNPRTSISQAVVPQIQQYLKLFRTTLPVSVAVEESHLMQKTLFEYQKKNKVALAYEGLVEDILEIG